MCSQLEMLHQQKNELEKMADVKKLHSKRVRKIWNYTRNELRRCKTTLETRGEDVKIYTRKECVLFFHSTRQAAEHEDDLTREAVFIDSKICPQMCTIRKTVDLLENMTSKDEWGMPGYHEMLFLQCWKNTLETSGEDVKITLETSVEDMNVQ